MAAIVVGLTLAGAFALWALQARANRQAILLRFAALVEDPALEAALLRDTVRFRRGGREVVLEVGTSPWGLRAGGDYPVRAELQLHHPPPVRVRIRVDRGLAALEKALGRAEDVEVAGGTGFDRHYLVETDEDAPAQGGLADAEVRGVVDRLLTRWKLDEVRIEGGRLFAQGAGPLLGKTMLIDLVTGLELLARAYDRRPEPRIQARPTFGWIGGPDSEVRCPYCHDVLGEVDLASCDGCATLLHAECHAENGGCPILGCGARAMDRVGPIPFDR